MTSERWHQVTNLFEAALERDAAERSSFVTEACAGDEELRREVEAMLQSHEQAESFIEEPAMLMAARQTAGEGELLTAGSSVGRYRVLSLITAGGMGEVYLAEDPRLGRPVALKLLPDYFARDEQRVRRFDLEARAASALNHPNIVTIHEIGHENSRHFIATEFVEGETLRSRISKSRLSLDEILDIATQISSALAAAHAAGIVHRDIKPENIMLRSDGILKVVDFGVAKLVGKGATIDTGAVTKTLINTDPGLVMGTVGYMSPEQARGSDVDARTDIWSLGCVLYEMLAGQAPFHADNAADTIAAIIKTEPAPLASVAPDVPPELAEIVSKSLRKEADERYQNVKNLLDDLRQLKNRREFAAQADRAQLTLRGDESTSQPEPALETTASPINSLAVLPMSIESDDPNVEYLSDGLTESIINHLCQLPQLKVMARSTVFNYKGRTVGPKEVGRDLGVRAVLTGRVRQIGKRLIVRTELVDATGGWQLWGGQYDRYSSDILELQETIAQDISDKLELKLSGEEQNRLTKRYTESSEAYLLYIKGRYYLNKRLTAAIQSAIEYFQQAIDVDPTYAPAYVGLSDCYPLLNLYGALSPRDAYSKAAAAARKALEIDNSLAEAHSSLGVIKLFYEWDWAGAEAAFRQALELSPGYPDAHQRYGMLLVARGRFAEAVARLKRAEDLDPLSLITRTISGYPFYYARAYEQAAVCFQEVIQMDRKYSMAHFRLGLTYAQQRRYEEAVAELHQSAGLSGDRDVVAALGYVYGLGGRTSEAQAALEELQKREQEGFVSAYDRAVVHVGLGNIDAAMDSLEQAYDQRSYWLIYLQVDPVLDPLRHHPRFVELAKKVIGADEISTALQTLPVRGEPLTVDRETGLRPGDLILEKVTQTRVVVNEIEELEKLRSGSMIASGKSPRSRWLGFSLALLALVLLGAFTFAIIRFTRRSESKVSQTPALPFQNIKLKRLTYSGDITDATVSPDGKFIALVTSKTTVWIQNVATGSRFKLLENGEGHNYGGSFFSADGNHLYYLMSAPEGKRRMMRAPVFPGPSQEQFSGDFWNTPAMAPDGKQFAFMRQNTELGEQYLIIFDGRRERQLIKRKLPDYFVLWGQTVAWSPDGKALAFVEELHRDTKVANVVVANVNDGSEMRLPNQGRQWSYLFDLRWLPEGNGLLVVAREGLLDPFQIWRVSYPSGEWHQVTKDLSDYFEPSVSADGSCLVTLQEKDFSNLWLLPDGDIKRARQLTFGDGQIDGRSGVSWTADGRIVFTSNVNGSLQISVVDQEGTKTTQLTNGEEACSMPFVTPDGRYIVFKSYRERLAHIFRMDIDGGNVVQLTNGLGEDWPSVTPDGQNLIYMAMTVPLATLWRVPFSGGTPVQLTDKFSTWSANSSPDGRLLATSYFNPESKTPWQIGIYSNTGGLPIKSFPDAGFRGIPQWSPDSKSVMYVDNGYSAIRRQRIDGGPATTVLTLSPQERIYNFAFSRDHKQLVIARGKPQSDVVLIENVK